MTDSNKQTGAAAFTKDDPLALDNLRKVIEQFKIPGVNIDALVEWQRKDFETLVEADRQAREGFKTLVERRTEILQESLAQWQEGLKNTQGTGALGKPAETVEQNIRQALDNFRRLAETDAQVRDKAWKVMQDRLQDNVANLQKLLQPK